MNRRRSRGGQDGAGDPDDGDDPINSDSDGGDGGDGGGDGEGDYHAALLAKAWTLEIHYDLHGDAYYHPKPLSPLYAATTLGAPCSTGWSIRPTLTTPTSMRWRCTSVKGVRCTTSTMLSQHGSHMQLPSEMLPGKR